MKMTYSYELHALQIDPNHRGGKGTWRMEEKQGGSEAGRRK